MKRTYIFIFAAMVFLPLSMALAAAFGPVYISPDIVAKILLNQTGLFHFTPNWPSYAAPIVLDVRLPQIVEGAIVGVALALSGVLFQGLLRNPLADPFLLGASSGAALGATIAFAIPAFYYIAGFYGVPLLAFAGSLLSVALVYMLARVDNRAPVVTLLLSGVAVSALLGAAQTIIITQNAAVSDRIGSLYLWLSGGIILNTWWPIGAVAFIVCAAFVVAALIAPVLDTFAVGEENAAFLGVRVERAKFGVVAAASLLVACAVSLSGLVGFVGLVIPHICRQLIGPKHRPLIIMSLFTGGSFLIWADTLARVFMPAFFHTYTELPLGVVTALIGGPFFLWLLRRSSRTTRA